MHQISRDPFARTTLLRERIYVHSETCVWCGHQKVIAHSSQRYLFRYSTKKDGIHTQPQPHSGLFCSKSCHDSYHGG